MGIASIEKSQNFVHCVAFGLRNKGVMLDEPSIEYYAIKIAAVFGFKGNAKALIPRIQENLSDYYRQRIINDATEDAIQAGDGDEDASALPFARRYANIYSWQGNLQEVATEVANEVVLRSATREVFLPPMLRAKATKKASV